MVWAAGGWYGFWGSVSRPGRHEGSSQPPGTVAVRGAGVGDGLVTGLEEPAGQVVEEHLLVVDAGELSEGVHDGRGPCNRVTGVVGDGGQCPQAGPLVLAAAAVGVLLGGAPARPVTGVGDGPAVILKHAFDHDSEHLQPRENEDDSVS